jgi:hypothetical protein
MKLFASLLAALIGGCAATQSPVPVGALISNPQFYQGKSVRVCGLLTDSLENCSLAQGAGTPVPNQAGWVDLPPSVWVSTSSGSCAPGNPDPMNSEPIRTKVVVEGVFQTGARYGHLGLATSQIVAHRVISYTGVCNWAAPNNSFKPKPLRGSA